MIDIVKLRAVNHIVTHAFCPDGMASALILQDALPEARVSFMKYGTKELEELPAKPGMLFCDFSPPKERTQEFVEVGTIVLDHHTKELVEPFGDFGVFGRNESSESGAVLAYREVWVPIVKEGMVDDRRVRGPNAAAPISDFASLAGIRDTWQTKSPLWKEACEQAEALLFYPFGTVALEDFFPGGIGASLGILLFEKKLEAARGAIESAHRFVAFEDVRVVMFQGVATTSDAAEILNKETDLVVGFRYFWDDETKLQFSLRSHTGFDCSELARAYGGNGHKEAAGFVLRASSASSVKVDNPFRLFSALLNEWTASRFGPGFA